MDYLAYRPHLSRSLLIQLAVMTLLAVALILIFRAPLDQIYFTHQQTSAGLMLNGLILVLFFIGMAQLLFLLLRYRREERALALCSRNLDEHERALLDSIPPSSLIGARLATMEALKVQKAEIDHQALAATLVAAESTRNEVSRFIHNVLILCGVLGTIMSLSLALFGASSLFASSPSTGGMGLVFHGMSTALSTTMTAILCYLFFAYFHGGVQNVQTNILAAVEHLTATRLLPLFSVTPETISREAMDLLAQARDLAASLQQQVEALEIQRLAQAVREGSERNAVSQQALLEAIEALQAVMRQGFRLPGETQEAPAEIPRDEP